MKTSFSRNILNRLVVVILTGVCAPAIDVAAQVTDEKKFVSGFDQYTRTSLVRTGKYDPASLHFKSDGLRKIKRYDFKSKKSVEPRTYLRFSMSVYEYDTPELAKTAFDEFRGKLEEGFSKSPQYFLLGDNRIYWLSGACLYSRKNWDAIELKLHKSLLGDATAESDNTIKVLCGGTVL